MAELVKIDIESYEGGGHIILDGQDISSLVAGYQVQAEPGYAPIVTLHFMADLEMDGVAVARKIVPDSAVLETLRGINPNELEAEALSDLGMGDRMVPTLLEHLIKKVEDGTATG